jgi:glycosyltransferase involved in cell wall biosynthesis
LCDALAAENDRISTIHQSNAGVSAARNTGIKEILDIAAQTDYVAFLDADDFWVPGSISDSFAAALSSSSSDTLIAMGTLSCNQSVTRFAKNQHYGSVYTHEGPRSIWKVGGHLGACLYPVSLFCRYSIRFIDGLRYCEDKIFQMQCVFFSSNVCFHPVDLYVYRDNDASVMKKAASMPAIAYLLPIIDGWISSDSFINQHRSPASPEFGAGRVLAGIYFMEMAAEHYKQWGKKSELMDVLRTHPHACLLEQMRLRDVSAKQYQNRTLLLEKHWLFKLKYNLIGLFIAAARLLLKVPFLAKWRLSRKYPFTELPISQ